MLSGAIMTCVQSASLTLSALSNCQQTKAHGQLQRVTKTIKPKPKRKRTTKPPEERRSDLLNASASVFAKDGVANAKVEDITALANVSKGTFYLYFESKDEAAAAVWARFIDEFIQIGEVILMDRRTPIHVRLSQFFEQLIRCALINASLQLAMFDATGAADVKSVANLRLIKLFAKAVREGIKSGDLECVEPELVASSLYHGICGSVADVIRSKKRPNIGLMVRTALWMVPRVFALDHAPLLHTGRPKRQTRALASSVSPASKKNSPSVSARAKRTLVEKVL
jgi:AcrR family transcriptional regulator